MPRYWTDFERNPFIWITGEPEIGEDTWVGPFTVLDGAAGLSIGAHCSIGAGAHIYTHQMKAPGRETGELERAETEIGDHVYIGANAVVNLGCTIGDDATIAAGAVLPKETIVKDGEIWAGVPANNISQETSD